MRLRISRWSSCASANSVRAVNQVGAAPGDLVAILEALKLSSDQLRRSKTDIGKYGIPKWYLIAAVCALEGPFFSFTYDGKPSAELLPAWKMTKTDRKIDDQRVERESYEDRSGPRDAWRRGRAGGKEVRFARELRGEARHAEQHAQQAEADPNRGLSRKRADDSARCYAERPTGFA